MDFRKLLQEERRRARAGVAQKAAGGPPHGPSDRDKVPPPTGGSASVSDSHETIDLVPMSCWRARTVLDLEPFRVPGIQSVFYIPEWLSQDEEYEILARVYGAAPSAWVSLKRRRLQMYGGEVKTPFRQEPLPCWLEQLAEALVANGIFHRDVAPNHALINEYGVGDGILPHEDGPSYFPLVAIASTGADAFVAFAPHRRHAGDPSLAPGGLRFAVRRRSLLLFTEDAYTKHLHSIDGVESGHRVSLTIRHVLATPEP